ncbi:hypothetical protein [Lactobacillus panisapium]|uniref:hypothetical protein n=1 Tax=Lactobacillus panisapium TaxID=2012495 RepID=UPI001C69E83D|nr:hypothetical protein [Lactobacillus panisapium]
MKIVIKDSKKIETELGSIVALKKEYYQEYYIVIKSNNLYYLANLQSGHVFANGYSPICKINAVVRMYGGTVYSGSNAKLILKGDKK